jgi:photosystem II stability/assembly factor-like uncharacterized protein
MIRFQRGALAAAMLCALLAACGGGGGGSTSAPPPTPPTQLPASISITSTATAETGSDLGFSSSLTTTQGITFQWAFGDGATAADAAPTHAYAKAGSYQVTLTVSNTANDSRSASFAVTVAAYANVHGLACTGANGAGWCWQDTPVTPHRIAAWAFVPGAGTVFAVGRVGTIVATADGGDTWATRDAGVTDDLVDVRFRDADHGLALSSAGYALRTVDGGQTWGPLPVTGMSSLTPAIAAFDGNQIIIDSDDKTLASHDFGATWTDTGLVDAFVVGQDCWSVSAGAVYTEPGCLGTPVQALPAQNTSASTTFLLASFYSPSHGIVLATSIDKNTGLPVSQTWNTGSAGASWTHTTYSAPDVSTFTSVHLTDGTDALAFDATGGVWAATFDGTNWATWAPVALPADIAQGPGLARGVLASTNQLWVATPQRMALRAAGGWQEVNGPEAALDLVDAQAPHVEQWADANDVIASVADRTYVTHDGGTTWTRVLGSDPRDEVATATWFGDSKHGVVASADGSVRTTADGGQTWSSQDLATASPGAPVALQFASAQDGWLLLGGTLRTTGDGGATWATLSLPAQLQGTIVAMGRVDAAHAFAGLADCCHALLYATSDEGATWQALGLPADAAPVVSLAFEDALTGVVVSSDNVVRRTVDGGATWTTVGTSATGTTVQHTGAHTFWLSGLAGATVARSTDDGATWSLVTLPKSLAAPVLAGSDDQHVWIATQGTVLASADAGATWTAEALPADTAATSLFAWDGATVWAATAGGQVLATATGGR